MNFRSVLPVVVIVATLSPAACLELETTNGSGGAGGGGTGTGAAGGMSFTTSGGGGSCAASSTNCEECMACSSMGPCAAEYQACVNSMECILVANCMQGCSPGSFSCWETCLMMSKSGANLFVDYDVCVFCKECNQPCADAQLCLD